MKKGNDSRMEWRHGCARFQENGTWYRSGIVCVSEKPYVMHGFIVPEDEDMEPFDATENDDEPVTAEWEATAEAAVMRFFKEGYVVGEGQYQNMCIACVLDGDKYPPIYAYSTRGRNPRTAQETWDWFTVSMG